MVEIKITGNTPLEALASVTAFGLHCTSNPDVYAAANRILEAEKTKEAKETTKVSKLDTGTPATVTASTGASAKSDNVTDLPPEPYVEEPPQKLTLETVRAAGVAAARKHGKETVKAVLDSLGEVGMTSMAPDNYAAFMRKLGELDAG